MSTHITLTTGIYDAIKEVIRTKKVSHEEELRLIQELRHAKQVRRKELSPDTVTVNRSVRIKDHTNQQETDYLFVASNKAKIKKNKHSILSDIALATVGYKVGDVIEWPFRDGKKTIEIMAVAPYYP